MKSSHTPGPWTVEPDQMFESKVLGPKINGAWPILHQGDLADSKLIAAAPDLLEACKAILKCNHELGAISRPIADQARAAIAKAEGNA